MQNSKFFFFFSSRRRHTRCSRDWSSDVCSSDLLPTEERVAAMLAGCHRKPDEIVGRMRSTHFREYWEYSVEKVAVNAVMAGGGPQYFPGVLPPAATGGTARGSSPSARGAQAGGNRP